MAKQFHEVRDPVHAFVRLTTDERKVLDSRPFQRLRYIHQLALTYLVYPGATHKRFEHSLGVMELATRIFDVVTNPANLTDDIRDVLPVVSDEYQRNYWRRVLRVAALCHDMGHLPFSHAAEKELLPEGWKHEQLTRAVIDDVGLSGILAEMKLQPVDVVKLALGPRETPDLTFSTWEAILAEIIVGDAFGADRMDYLLRDSHHAGVAYGRFDHYRLIDTLRILPPAPSEAAPVEVQAASEKAAEAPAVPAVEHALGIQEGGLHSAEALMLARYFMFSQLYFHPIRRIYDIHLKDFLKLWLPNGQYSTAVPEHLKLTDSHVIAGILQAADSPEAPGHDPAKRIAERQHFRLIYQRHPDDVKITSDPGRQVAKAAIEEFGQENVRGDRQRPKGRGPAFPVQAKDGRIVSSVAISETLTQLPTASFDYVFVAPQFYKKALEWLARNRKDIIKPQEPTPHG